MTREDLEHIIRAAADVAGDREIVVVGSQAILGGHPDAPRALLVSDEADVYPRNHPERALEVDGALGDGSPFYQTFGFYAHGVGPETAKAPAGWEERLVPVRVRARPSSDDEVVGWCLEAHDVVLAKCAAGREQDWSFATVAVDHGLVELDELRRRVDSLPLDAEQRTRVATGLDALGA